jgi:hypothetical protein
MSNVLSRDQAMCDDFVKSPISALRFIPLSLRRTARTPHSTGFARLELGLFTKPSGMTTFYEFIKVWFVRDVLHTTNSGGLPALPSLLK